MSAERTGKSKGMLKGGRTPLSIERPRDIANGTQSGTDRTEQMREIIADAMYRTNPAGAQFLDRRQGFELLCSVQGPAGALEKKKREAIRVARWCDKNPGRFREWFDTWKHAPDIEFLRMLLWVSQDEGVILFQKATAAKMHEHHRSAVEKIPDLWVQHQKNGTSKNDAAKEIAKTVNLSPTTVRKKLQGL